MNKTYRLVFNEITGAWIAVAEHVKTKGKRSASAVMLAPGLAKPDEAYPTMMHLLPTGLLGLVFAALIAAIIASTASKINSIATIFTLDIYSKFGPKRDERHLVTLYVFND